MKQQKKLQISIRVSYKGMKKKKNTEERYQIKYLSKSICMDLEKYTKSIIKYKTFK